MSRPVKLAVELKEQQAQALAQLCKRFGWHHAKMLSSEFTRYGDEAELDVMLEAVFRLSQALAGKGFAPR